MRGIDKGRADALEALTRQHLDFGDVTAAEAKKANARKQHEHWRWHKDRDGIAWLILDKAGAGTNTLSEAVLRELNAVLIAIERAGPDGLIIRSAKTNGFVAGAEIGEFKNMRDEAVIIARLNEALAVLDRLAAFSVPTVAAIHGFCLGGGLELALACDSRIARPDAKLGFPEIMLGLHPGLAGTWRSMAVMNPVQAMGLMLTGRSLSARAARRAGLVDAVVEERHIEAAAKAAIAGGHKKRRRSGVLAWLLRTVPARAFSGWRMQRQTSAKVRKAHYPAPFALIDLWKQHGGSDKEMRAHETESFARLLAGDAAQNLARVFFLREGLKAHAKVETANPVAHVHVIGAGTMGGDIAAWSALSGFRVTLQDRAPEFIAPAIRCAATLFKRKLKREGDVRAALDRLQPDISGDGPRRADLVIEVVPEDLKIKQAVFRDAEARMRRDAILATNTSSILLEHMREGLSDPGRLVGLHFFNPVARMPLVEVVTHNRLRKDVRDRALKFVGDIDKLPVPVRSAPGFLVNRALMPCLMEALAAYGEGVAPETIDAAATAFGMPMGPIELADRVGLDVCLHVAGVLKRDLKGPFPDIPDWFSRMVESGDLGVKTGKGFYSYKNGKPKKRRVKTTFSPALQDRLILPLVNACAACVREGVVESADAADAGLIFGSGFAPFLGGPLAYARERGAENVISTLEGLATIHGPHLKPDKGLKATLSGGKTT